MSGARTGRSPIRPTWPQIVALSAIGPILFGCVALWMGSAMHRTDHSRADLARSFEYRRELEVVGSLLKDAETGQRGYILSGDASFLGPYQLARHRLPDQLDLIERLAPATPQTTLVHRELTTRGNEAEDVLTRSRRYRVGGHESDRPLWLRSSKLRTQAFGGFGIELDNRRT